LLVSRQALEADLFITLPKFKTHLVTTITGAVKNSFGLLVGGQKSEMHRLARSNREFCEAVVDVYQVRPPDLAIMDAVTGMQGMGPSSDDLREVGKLMACRNAVTLDAVMAMMMGAQPEAVGTLRTAHERGLGEIRRERIEVDGRWAPIKDFKLPFGHMRSVVATALARLFTYIMVKRPVVDREVCARCGLCAKQCPVEAIALDPYPVIDREKCFSCFCCHEFCKHNAVRVTRSVRFWRRVIDH
jgi:ferredoxin